MYKRVFSSMIFLKQYYLLKELVKSKILCFNNYGHNCVFFSLKWKIIFLICCETYMLTISGEISSVSLNSLLITLDGSILLVVWPGFLKTNVLFKKIIQMKYVKFAQ